jgi:hypothetical protein
MFRTSTYTEHRQRRYTSKNSVRGDSVHVVTLFKYQNYLNKPYLYHFVTQKICGTLNIQNKQFRSSKQTGQHQSPRVKLFLVLKQGCGLQTRPSVAVNSYRACI